MHFRNILEEECVVMKIIISIKWKFLLNWKYLSTLLIFNIQYNYAA